VSDPDKRDDDALDLDLGLDDLDLEPLDAPAGASGSSGAGTTPAATGAASGGSEGAAETLGAAGGAEAGGLAAAGASAVAEPAAAAASPSTGGEVPGQWVWQYGAPPPPPPFSAVFFSGRALGELYRFFACGLLVFVGSLLPWGASYKWMVETAEPTVGYVTPAGYELPIGALSLALALWLMFSACYGIYTGRQKILPVFLMLLPAWATWTRTLDAWSQLEEFGTRERLERLFEVAGTGVLLTLAGSTIVALSLLIVIVKIGKRQPAEARDGARARKPKDTSGDDKPKVARSRAGKDADAATDRAGEAGAPAAPTATATVTAGGGESGGTPGRRGRQR
jgi:hypothetical protein